MPDLQKIRLWKEDMFGGESEISGEVCNNDSENVSWLSGKETLLPNSSKEQATINVSSSKAYGIQTIKS